MRSTFTIQSGRDISNMLHCYDLGIRFLRDNCCCTEIGNRHCRGIIDFKTYFAEEPIATITLY